MPHHARFPRSMTPLLWGCLIAALVIACSGPQPLSVAVRPQQEQAYMAQLEQHGQAPRPAWLAWRAQQRGTSVDEAATWDQQLSTADNPFNARRDQEAVALGALVYKAHCASCHGDSADGRGPAMSTPLPSMDFHRFSKRFAVTLHGGAPRKWFARISDGVQGPPAMPAFKDTLTREQIWLTVTYLQSLDADAKEGL